MTIVDEQYAKDEQRWSRLMANAQQGNHEDYQQLLTELGKTIHHYLYSRLGKHHFIEDCVQECLIAIHKSIHTYDTQRLFRPWLFAIVRHKAIDYLRKQKSYQRTIDQQQSEHELLSFEATENQLSQGQLVACLTPDYREAITLTKIHGFSNSEAADRLSISEGAVKVRVHRAINQLRALFERDQL